MKLEFGFEKGEFVALAPKSYYSYDHDEDQVKMGSKGIPRDAKLDLETYVRVLFENDSHYVDMRNLQLKNGEMSRICTKKKGLSNIFYKYQVADDNISCSPLKIDNYYL